MLHVSDFINGLAILGADQKERGLWGLENTWNNSVLPENNVTRK